MKSPQIPLRKAHRRSRIPLSCEACRSRKYVIHQHSLAAGAGSDHSPARLRCNREKPCQNCSARGEQTFCKFREPANTTHTLSGPKASRGAAIDTGAGASISGDSTSADLEGTEAAPGVTTFVRNNDLEARPKCSMNVKGQTSDDIGQRINHLEDLVNRLVAERPSAWTPPHSVITSTASTCTPDKSEKTEGECSGASDATPEDAFAIKAVGRTVMDGGHSVYLDGDDWSVILQEASGLIPLRILLPWPRSDYC